eukprot:jgi/Psemu1/252650/estExt_Genewise1Plus.C_530041
MQSLPLSIPTTHIKLQFDGCLRPPRDPGFPTISHRMAVCAACVGLVHENNNNSSSSSSNNTPDRNDSDEIILTPLAVGAVALPVTTEMTSQHAEYEGLLLGLEWLVEYFSRPDPNEHWLAPRQQRVLISIEGDCKTVMDQLSGKSIPRKLESLYDRTQTLLHRLTSNNSELVEIECYHIPRSQNPISDALCNNLMTIVAAKSWRHVIHQVHTATGDAPPSTGSRFLSRILEESIPKTKHSLRPPLYELVAALAVENEDYPLLVSIGERLVEEGSPPLSLRRTGILLQIEGWKRLGSEKKVRFLERKHRVFLAAQNSNENENENAADRTTTESLGDTSEGDWEGVIPNTWKPTVEKWFLSARYEENNELVPVWVENTMDTRTNGNENDEL